MSFMVLSVDFFVDTPYEVEAIYLYCHPVENFFHKWYWIMSNTFS